MVKTQNIEMHVRQTVTAISPGFPPKHGKLTDVYAPGFGLLVTQL